MKYSKFAAMIITSTIAMFIMMYLNTYTVSHIWFSETRSYMALYMGGDGHNYVGVYAGNVHQ